MHTPLAELAQWVWPTSCPVCAEPGSWCAPCQPNGPPRVLPGDFPVVAVDDYEGPVGAVIRAWKLGGRHDLTRPLAVHLAGAIRAVAGRDPVLLVPVPTRPSSRRRRGADLLAEVVVQCARAGGWQVAQPLAWRRAVVEQVGAGAAMRRANLHGSMRAERLPRGPVIVIDDVRTTGATLGAAVSALRAAGSAQVGAAVLATANLPDPVLRRSRAAG